MQIFEDFKKIDSDQAIFAFVKQYVLIEEPAPTRSQILGIYVGLYEGTNVKVTHRWYDPSGPFSIQPDIYKVKLEVEGHQSIEVSYKE